MIDASLVDTLKLASLAFSVAHTAMAGYGVVLASQAGEAAPAWFIKILFTGVGGLNELKGIAATQTAEEN